MMKLRGVGIILALVVAVGLGLGWWLGRSATRTATDAAPSGPPPRPRRVTQEMIRPPRVSERPERELRFDRDAAEAGALPGQRFITFADRAAMERFLAAIAGKGIAVLGRIDAFNTLRIGFLDADELAALLDGTEETGYIYPVQVPGNGSVQDGAVGFGRSLLAWLGLSGDLSGAGDGVRVAVLDTGIANHSAFSNLLRSLNLVDLPSDLSTQNGHGTAVASLIASSLGLAPGASLLDFRIADETGTSNTFTLAEAILAATDAGVDIINISMGSSGDSLILKRAIEYALQAGVVVVASAGNEGIGYVSYPAAYEGVVGVGAVDANSSHLDFSNYGNITLTAPGLDIATAWPGDETVYFSGTSASAPIVSGAIALLMSELNLNARQALDLLVATANENGAPGADSAYGEGVVNLGRALQSEQSGITDVALASNYVTSSSNGTPILQVTVENRGTATIVNAPVTVTTPWGSSNLNVSTLAPGAIRTFELPFNASYPSTGDGIRIDSSVNLSGGTSDVVPSNNRRTDVYSSAEGS